MNQISLVQRVLELTEAIAAAVQLADWQQAAELSETRLPLLTSIDASQAPAELLKVRRIQALDHEIMAQSHTWKAGLHADFAAAMRQARAAGAYQAAARF